MCNMPRSQNLHVLQNNCVIMPGSNIQNPNGLMHHHHHMQPPQQQHHQTHLPAPAVHALHQTGKRPIAPAPVDHTRSSVISGMDHAGVRSSSKKAARMNFMPYGTQPASVQRRNARERNRVKQVNNGFANLRQHIPSDVINALTHGGRGASKKLSKVDTLRLAVEYIRRLQDLLDDPETDASSSSSTRSSQLSTDSYYTTSQIPPPPCSESSASPTPSYSSENSSISNNYVAPVPYYKNEMYGDYGVEPEDEELLDCISWWQQQ